MTLNDFIAKWQFTTLKERSAAQEHFLDLCALLNEPTPASIDPKGEFYCFERGAKKAGGGDGWADVWKRGHFGWEYKSPGKNLEQAFKQLQLYTPSLEYPPLLIVSDMAQIIIHTAFTGTVPKIHSLALEDLRNPAKLQLLKWAFSEPERLRPTLTTAALTEKAARQFGELAQTLRERDHDTQQVAHFCQQILFCFFAEDIGLLPNQLFSKLLEIGQQRLEHLPPTLTNLFNTMATGGFFGTDSIDWFNGGLFNAATPLPLTRNDVRTLRELSQLNWSAIEPSIFGTLFERGLDPNQREQLGAHYTDSASIMRLVNPVVLDPLREYWHLQKIEIADLMQKADTAKSVSARTKAIKSAQALLSTVFERLRNFRVLDPACGSGNFLLLALRGLKDLEHTIILDAEQLGLPRSFPQVGPENVLGIETNVYAAELARVTVWIGEIQWMVQHGFSLSKNPILKPIHIIDQRDSILDGNGKESDWPIVDAIVGNPPFLGGSKKRGVLGDDYFSQLGTVYFGRIPNGADLVCYWFEKARAQIETAKPERKVAAGLVATNSIRGGANRQVLERICETTTIFNAWSDEPWINSGAAVRVSLICFGNSKLQPILNNEPVAAIYADLTAGDDDKQVDLTIAKPLLENDNVSFEGTKKYGAFDISGDLARSWLKIPNPHGLPTSNVVKPWRNGKDITSRASDTWIIDFGVNILEFEAALYELPFQYLLKEVKPYRDTVKNNKTKKDWFFHERTRPEMRKVLNGLSRYICTPRVAKHRLFIWLDKAVLPDSRLIILAREDDVTFGILSSRIHQIWSLATCSWHGVGNDPTYNGKSCFETFPFPIGLTPADTNGAIETLDSGAIIPTVATEYRDHAIAIAEAAFQLNRLRENWLNPPEWIERIPEVVAGYPDRIIAKPEFAEQLKKRTLTNLYNQKPAWLVNAHFKLDHAVAAAYGWANELSEIEILQRLLALNKARNNEYVN
ncbi:SAM-dependent methyltransferase [Chromatium weissei]|nr:SAM-dependent methyltransferase [Chromatium weissei]